jgi:hypothetical protein
VAEPEIASVRLTLSALVFELEVLDRGGVRVHIQIRRRLELEDSAAEDLHDRPSGQLVARICWIAMITNSAGLNGAKPTRMLTVPRSRSFWDVSRRT